MEPSTNSRKNAQTRHSADQAARLFNLARVIEPSRIGLFFAACLLAFALLCGPVRAAAPAIDFARDIRPILSDKCFTCHGPDEKARKARLRLDVKEGAFARSQDGGRIINPGDPSKSEIYRRITASDPDEVMPPLKSNLALSKDKIELIRRWIELGAKWNDHWAFVAPGKAPLPQVKNSSWSGNPIDCFIAARLERESIAPLPEARKERLIRRVSLDLSGLPPTLPDVEAFLADHSPDAYEKIVDRLLASPRYGERMASDWLDLARYADTHGYQMDRYRPMWPWRDWVIKAFNQNLSFNEFVLWQLAGDLLPNPTKEQRLATAFNRLHLQNEEGGIVEEEFRVAYVVDRVNTFGTAFLGLTFECARCHDHKFDPITMRDFYSLYSFFQNIDESGQTVYFGEVMPVPAMLLSTEAQDAKLVELKNKIGARQKELTLLRGKAQAAFEEWLQRKTNSAEIAGLVAAFSFDEVISNHVANFVQTNKPAKVHDSFKLVPGRNGHAALLDGENGFTFPGIGGFTRADPFSFSLWLQTPAHAPRFVIFHKSKAWMDAGSRGYELLLEEGKVSIGLHHMWPGDAIKVQSQITLPTHQWVHVAFTYDGSSRAEGVKLYINADPVALEVIRDRLSKDITYGGSEPDLAIGHRFRDSGFKGGSVDEFRIFNRALTRIEVAQLAGRSNFTVALATEPARLGRRDREQLFDYFLANVYKPSLTCVEELHGLLSEQSKLIEPIPEAMVMEELSEPKPAYVLVRGAYDRPGERVTANTPAVLPPFPPDAPRNRLGLARWLLDPGNPLVARVTVNRAWQQMFGRGIVETADNFGSQGAPPTHRELLDWLARDFVAGGWDMKRLLKLIATSATYRQSSSPDQAVRQKGLGLEDTFAEHFNASTFERAQAIDPDNRLLWHAPARRLTAEMLRDQALALSGLLNEKIGGPSVKPYQPPGLWEIAMGNPRYDQSKGADLHRRSLYTFWKRTVPPPTMITFDGADRNVCTVRRQSTSTPLQALALLNDTQLVETARHISQRMLTEGGHTLNEQVSWAFRWVTGRKASAREQEVLEELLVEQRKIFAADPDATEKLLAVGDRKNDSSFSRIDLAAGTILAKALLNHDEALMRR